MMDNGPSPPPTAGSLLGLHGGAGAASQLSPYLNVNPAYLQSQTPEYIFNQEHKRGRMENSFTAIGTSVLVGSAVGGAYGIFDGIRQTSNLEGKLRRTQIVNYTLKSGGVVAKSLGAIAVMYSSIHALASIQFEQDTEAKSMMAGALTGAIFKSTAGIKKCAAGGAFGLGLAAVWALLLKKDERVSYYV